MILASIIKFVSFCHEMYFSCNVYHLCINMRFEGFLMISLHFVHTDASTFALRFSKSCVSVYEHALTTCRVNRAGEGDAALRQGQEETGRR